MEIQFIRTGYRDYVCRAYRDDGCVVHVPGYGGRSSPPHDYGHYLVDRIYAPDYGLWGMIAAGAVWGSMRVLSGRRPPHSAERTKAILDVAEEAHSSSEGLVSAFQKITDGDLDHDWRASRQILDVCVDYRAKSRPRNLQEVQEMCAAFREAGRRWSEVGIGGSLTVSWRTILSWRDRRFAPSKRHRRH